MSDLPYRPNVGAVLFNPDGLVFVARRADMPNAEGPAGGWQLPQGGIDEGENPRTAVLRELEEEIGTAKAERLGLKPDAIARQLKAMFLGQIAAQVVGQSRISLSGQICVGSTRVALCSGVIFRSV